jgi:hypothetical protein
VTGAEEERGQGWHQGKEEGRGAEGNKSASMDSGQWAMDNEKQNTETGRREI